MAEAFFDLRAKKRAFYAVLAHLRCPVVTVVTFSSNLSNFERKRKKRKKSKKNPKKIQKIQKSKNPKNLKKIQKKSINPKKSKMSIKNPQNPKIFRNGQKIQKSQNILKNFKNSLFLIFFCNFFFAEKKCYYISFLILGGRNSTRALQSTPFQNPGGSPERDTRTDQRKSSCSLSVTQE